MEPKIVTDVDETMLSHMGKMERPVPGESLTSSPENPQRYERPPKFTDQRQALEFIFEKVTDEQFYVPVMSSVAEGMPIMNITQNILFQGFRAGKWNPDLMLLLAEPTAYVLMALAERADIDYIVGAEDEEDDREEAEVIGSQGELAKIRQSASQIKEKEKPLDAVASSVRKDAIPQEIQDKVEQVDVPDIPASSSSNDSLIKRK